MKRTWKDEEEEEEIDGDELDRKLNNFFLYILPHPLCGWIKTAFGFGLNKAHRR